VVTVAENPVVNSVTFEGNKKIKENILSQIIDLKARGVLTDARLQSDVDRIKEYYSRSGRSGASVEPRVTPLGDNRVDVAFVIAEGGRTGVGSIQFVGSAPDGRHPDAQDQLAELAQQEGRLQRGEAAG
jgi:outer membrane protein insertion porin family